MIEQDMASIIKFVLTRAGDPAPYYWNVPQHFQVPAAFFPTPEADTGGETFLTFYEDYTWYIKLFHKTAQEAYELGRKVLQAIRAERNLIPLIEQDGSETPGEWVRVNDPRLQVLDDGAAQLTVSWRRRSPYADVASGGVQKVQEVNVDVFMRSGKTIDDAMADALEAYAVSANQPGGQPE